MYNNFCRVEATRAALAQAVAHLIGSEEVTSSNLVSSLDPKVLIPSAFSGFSFVFYGQDERQNFWEKPSKNLPEPAPESKKGTKKRPAMGRFFVPLTADNQMRASISLFLSVNSSSVRIPRSLSFASISSASTTSGVMIGIPAVKPVGTA